MRIAIQGKAFHTISDHAMHAHRREARDSVNGNERFRESQHRTHAGTQRAGASEMVSHTIVKKEHERRPSFVAVFKYADGSSSSFDGVTWTHKQPAA